MTVDYVIQVRSWHVVAACTDLLRVQVDGDTTHADQIKLSISARHRSDKPKVTNDTVTANGSSTLRCSSSSGPKTKLEIPRMSNAMFEHYQPVTAAMKLHILSDLHTEFADFSPPNTDADIVVLAGDIGVGTGGIEWAARHFPDVPVVYVPGNHEFYGHDVRDTASLSAAAPTNVHVLSDDALEIDGMRFVGCTLWTDFKLYGEGHAWSAGQQAKALIEDFTAIRNGNRLFTPEDSVDLHRVSVAWLVDELESGFDGPTVVVTHHLPAAPSIATRYKDDPLNPAFASRLEGVIEKYRPDLWIHGHTHVPCDYKIFGTRVVCNPRGYPSESSARGFSPGLIVEV